MPRNISNLVGLQGLEPPTSRLSGVRSNQLSYRPLLAGSRGFEPLTSGFGDQRSTTELTPYSWCPEPESNQRHEDFQSSALPTELPSHLRCALFQGLISITKDAFRSTENFKKVFEHSLGSINRHVRGISRQQEVFRSEPHGQTHLASSPRQPPVDEWPPSFPEES